MATYSEIFSTVLAFVFLVAIVITPIYMVVVGSVLHKAKTSENKDDIAKYAPLFEHKR